MFPLAVHQTEDHTSAKRSSSVASLMIDTTLEAEHDALPSGERDPTTACLRASQILRAHPGLVMEHYDPTTSVHTFKIAYRRPQQDEDPLLPSPATPSLSNSSRHRPLLRYVGSDPCLRRRGTLSTRASPRVAAPRGTFHVFICIRLLGFSASPLPTSSSNSKRTLRALACRGIPLPPASI
ncbi:hypothetical protein BC826DRAFT_1103109 [Russula brevipes]|nr:hypothetical protein BC826DRAFT_1103109 [Russula brevipes]